jgi:hypothetical protein
MIGIVYLLGYGAPIVIITVATVTGVYTAHYFRGQAARTNERVSAAAMLAPVIAIVTRAAVLVPTIDEIKKLYAGGCGRS